MYLLINLEGVWEVKFELLNDNVNVPPPPPPHSVNISARVLCFSTTYLKREHFFEFFCGKEVCMESFSLDHKRSVGKKLADVVFASYQYLYFNTLKLESTIALPFSHLFQINSSSDVDVFRQTGNVK